jgi:hypothetical protein
MQWFKSSAGKHIGFKLGEIAGWVNWDRITRVERENPWLGGVTGGTAASGSASGATVTAGVYNDSGKGKGKGKKGAAAAAAAQVCHKCGSAGHWSRDCPLWGQQQAQAWVQPQLQNWSPQVAPPGIQAPQMLAITSGGKDAGGKGTNLATQVQNAFGGKGGKQKVGAKGKGNGPKGF